MKNTVKFLGMAAIILATAAITTGCDEVVGNYVVTGSGKLETRTFDFTGFSRVEAVSAFEVTITGGTGYAVTITADDNLFSYLDVRKTSDTLHIGLKGARGYHNTTQRANIVMPELRGVELSGATRGTVSKFDVATPVTFEVSGASTLGFESVTVGNTDFEVSGASRVTGAIAMHDVHMDISGSSRVTLDGTAATVVMDASGASRAELEGLSATNCRTTLSGASEATVDISGRLDCEVTGASRLYYLGNPKIGDLNVSGASSISKK